MKKSFILMVTLNFVTLAFSSGIAQILLTSMDTPINIDFTSYNGSGFTSTPAAGQLDSDNWAATGMSDGNLDFGGTMTAGDYARGVTTGSITTGGFYALNDNADIRFMIQPTGPDWTPGTIILKIQNVTGETLTKIDVSYDLFINNDQDRSNSLNFSWSVDNLSYHNESAADYSSPELLDSNGFVPAGTMSISVTGINIVDGDYFYLKWTGNDIGGSGSRDEFALDNIQITAVSPPSNTTVRFLLASDIASEGDGIYDITVSITNPDPLNDTYADVVLISGDAADINNFISQTVTFPAGSSADQTVSITITDDMVYEKTDTLIFDLQNVSGGDAASVYFPDQFELDIYDDDIPRIMVSEIMQNPAAVADTDGEWFELYNHEDYAVDLNGWVIKDDGTDYHVINSPGQAVIPAKGIFVFGINGDTGLNGNYTTDYVYSGITLANGADEVVILLSDGITEVDRVAYDGGPVWPDPTGASMVFTGLPIDNNNNGAFWSIATSREYSYVGVTGDFGSPGSIGVDQSLPVELSSFTVAEVDETAVLRWETQSEIENLGFDVLRSMIKDGEYEEISSYLYDSSLKGAGTTSTKSTYSYTDRFLSNGVTYWYKLVDVDINGIRTEHGPVSATPHQSVLMSGTGSIPLSFALHQNYPNPFNPSTRISFDIPSNGKGAVNAELMVYDVLGRKVRTIVSDSFMPGTYEMEWDGKNDQAIPMSSGVYFLTLKSDSYASTRRMILAR